MREEWINWILHGEKSFTNGGAMRTASLDGLCKFFIKALENVKRKAHECYLKIVAS